MPEQPYERPNRHADVVSLGSRRPGLAPLHVAALLQRPIILLDRPAPLRQLETPQLIHRQVVGRPVSNVPVLGDHLEHPDRPESFELDDRSRRLDQDVGDGLMPLTVEIHPAVDLELREEYPAVAANQLEVVKARVPSVEKHGFRAKSSLFRRIHEVAEMIVLGQSVDRFVVDAVDQRHDPIAVGPDQSDEVDAHNNKFVLAGPVAMNRLDGLGVKLVERGVVKNQDAVVPISQRLDLAIEDFGVGFESLEQPNVGVVGGSIGSWRLASRRLAAARRAGSGDQEVDIGQIPALRLSRTARLALNNEGRNLYKIALYV